MRISDKERLAFMSLKGVTWDFTTQMGKGVYSWHPNERGDFHRSVRSMIDAAIRAERKRKKP